MFTINENSWHFTVMAVYRAIRNYDKFDKYLGLFTSNSFIENARSFTKNETLLPGDFCQYWRNVILWPVITLVLNLIATVMLISTLVFAILNPFSSAIMILGLLAVFVFFAIIFYIGCLGQKLWNKEFKNSFFDNVNKSIKGNFCSPVEYKKED